MDFGLYEDEVETKQKAKALKKKGNKPLGGKLIKMAQNQANPKPIKPRANPTGEPDSPEKQPYPVNNQIFKMVETNDMIQGAV